MDLNNTIGTSTDPAEAMQKALSSVTQGESTRTATPGDLMNSFGDALKQSLQKVNDLQVQSEQAAETYAVGGPIQLHQVLIASEKADLSMQLAVQVRNKMVEAYQQISQMNV